MCLDYVCKYQGIEYPGQDSGGEKDFGKSWRAVKQEFMKQMHRLLRMNLGLAMTSHSKEEEIKRRGTGERYSIIRPSMSNQARAVVEALVDLFIYAEYFQDKQGKVHRVLICEGDDTVWAGTRATGSGKSFPRFLPLLEKEGFKVIDQAFRTGEGGINPSDLMRGKLTSKTSEEFLRKKKKENR
jgi:hypothetical protein